jgi:polyphosphate kinase 2 (PPK2 family)
MARSKPLSLAVLPKGKPISLNSLGNPPRLSRSSYRSQLKALQLDMLRLQRRVVEEGLRVLLIFEGVDAAGKGGAIKRLTQHLDPRWLRVHSLSRPSAQDQSYYWLRRYLIRVPRKGRITIFDDYSWYGRMLVEPIEGLISADDYKRASREIREAERQLADSGYIILKLWLHVSEEEQIRRFVRREKNPLRSWKLTPEDWRTNEMYEHYVEHAERMFEQTHARHAPWFVIPGDDKLYARIAVIESVVEALDRHKAPKLR